MKFRFTEKHLESFQVFHINGKTKELLDIRGEPELIKELNDALEEHEKTLPVVYSTGLTEYGGWSAHQSNADHFKAMLWGMEEL